MLVHFGVTLPFFRFPNGRRYPFIDLGGESHCGAKFFIHHNSNFQKTTQGRKCTCVASLEAILEYAQRLTHRVCMGDGGSS